MEENSEFEEGEACYNEDDDVNVDPDALSYIDERIKQVLGHFQKDFEGGLTAENLGAKFGEYGSFLPTHKRSPSIWRHESVQRINHNTPNSVGSLPLEGGLQNLKASPNLSQPVRLQTNSSCSDVHNIREVSEKHESCFPLTHTADKCPPKNGSSIRSGSLTDLRSLKVRIKVKSDDVAQRNAAIYNGLGLDDSPYSSGDNLNGCERKSHMGDSPDNIIQVMTSFSVPGGLLISPLPDSLLWLSKKEKLSRESESKASFDSHQECPSQLVDETASLQGDTQLLKNKKKKSWGVNANQEELKRGNKRRFDCGGKNVLKKKSEEVVSRKTEFLANGLKCTSLSNSAGNYNESTKAVGGVPEISCDVNELRVKEKSFTSMSTEEMLDLVDEQDYRKNDKQSSSSSLLEKASRNKAVDSFNNNLVGIGCDDGSKSNTSASMKDYSDASKHENDVAVHKKVLKDTFQSENGSYLPFEKGNPAFTGKNNLKGMLGNVETVVSKKDNVNADVGFVQKDKKKVQDGVYSCNRKTDKLESCIDNKVEDGQRDFFGNKNVEDVGYCQATKAKASSVDLHNEHNLDSPRVQPTLGKKPNERLGRTKVDSDSISRASAKYVSSLCTPIYENGLTSDNAPQAVAPLLIEENWVLCDHCQKWRLLPFGLKTEQLPEKWLCSMLNWLPGMNRCDISEEETTAALNALYQLTASQNHTNGTTSGVATSNGYHLDQNHQNTSAVILDQGKKKQTLKGMKHAGGSIVHVSNSLDSHIQEPRRNINNKNHPPEPSLTRKSKIQHPSKLQNKVGEKNEHTLNDKPRNGVDAKKLKMKSKWKDNDGCRLSERSKTEEMNVGTVNLNSKFGSQTIQRADMKNSETNICEDSKCGRKDGILSVKKLGERTQTSSDGGSLDVQRPKRDSFTKKRKLKEDGPQCQDSALIDGVNVKDTSESGLSKEGKTQLIKTERKISDSSDGDGNTRKKIRTTPIYSLVNSDFPVDTTIVGDVPKDWKLGRHDKNGLSDTLTAVELQQKDCGSEQVATVAAISNSKVAGSNKTRVNYEEVNGSVEKSMSPHLRRCDNEAIIGCELVRKEQLQICRQEEDGDAMQKFSSRVLSSQLYNGDSNLKKKIGCINDSIYFSEQSNETIVKKTCDENAILSQKKLASKEDTVPISYHKMKDSDSFSNCPKKSLKIEPDVRPGSTKIIRNEKNHNGTKSSSGKRSIDNAMETQIKDRDCSDLRNGRLSNTNGKYGLQQNLSLNLECGSKVDNIEKEPKSGKSECLLNSEGKKKQAHKKAQDSHRQLLCTTDGEDMVKTTKMSVDYGMENGINHNLGQLIPERTGLRNRSSSSPDRRESLSKAANNTLKEAKNLRGYGDRLKSSGFHLESNEAYFQAALKFFHGASLLETYNAQSVKHGKASQLQFYHDTVKLFRACAEEHEKCQEMAAAALAYKCMEVAYMRIVYSKHFCFNRDWQELLTSLHAIPQGPQGQTSASCDVNSINQTTVDKNILSMDTSRLAAGNQAVVAQNQPHLVWLVDFTQIVNLAVEASRKSHNAFAAANVTVQDTQNKDFVASVKRVIDFSFEDVEEFIQLVHIALKFSSYSGSDGIREEEKIQGNTPSVLNVDD